MFERLSEGFSNVLRTLAGQSTITEANVRQAMVDVRTALLDADVNIGVVDAFCEGVVQDSLGLDVTKSLKPGQEMIGIVYRRLVLTLGGESPTPDEPLASLNVAPEGIVPRAAPAPTVVMMCGLQGSGKTTTCGKLAAYLKKRGRSVMLAAADLQRPAAVEQLGIVSAQVQGEMSGGAQVLFYAEADKVAAYGKAVGVAVDVCKRAYAAAQKAGVDTLILDTAGRLHINDALMGELGQIKSALKPHQVYLVVDAMTGQDAVTSAGAFHAALGTDGVILTKFDSDTRGGAALSVKQVTGAPIKFIGVGEKLEALEEFHADRMAGRILGMGDVVSLVEKAQQEVSEDEALKLQEKLEKGQLTMEDFLGQLRTIRRMGPLKSLLGLLPGVGSAIKDANIDEKQLDRVEAIVHSMTPRERKEPGLIDNSRRRRISSGSGTTANDVGQLVRQFDQVTKFTRQMAGMSARDKMRAVNAMSGQGGEAPAFSTRGSTYTPSVKDRFKKRKK